MVSGFNKYTSNNIYNNDLGVYLSDSFVGGSDEFYLNRLYNNKYFDFYSNSDYLYLIDNNWWGVNKPTFSNKNNVFSNIYDGKSNLYMNSWMVVNSFSTAYEIDDNGFIKRAKLYVETNYNNLGENLAIKGYIPNNLEVVFTFNQNNKTAYLNNGIAFVDVNLTNQFNSKGNLSILTEFDNQKLNFNLNKKAMIDTVLISSAIDISTGRQVDFRYSAEYSNVTWVTYAWSETGLFTGVIYEIVNGEIVNSVNIINNYYQMYKNKYRVEVFKAIKLFNNVFASTKEGVWSPNVLYQDFAESFGLTKNNKSSVESDFLSYLKTVNKFSDDEFNFIKENSKYFIDKVLMSVNYHGDYGKKINFNYNDENKLISMPEGVATRFSNIYYTNIIDENGMI